MAGSFAPAINVPLASLVQSCYLGSFEDEGGTVANVSSPGQIQFDEIVRAEVDAINQRREALGRPRLDATDCASAEGQVLDAVGLALSGGGIRSAAVSLGVLQAFNHSDALGNVDYLSTVSGGGYMGTALTATMTSTGGNFVFGNAPTCGAEQAASEIADTPEVGHLRNYSNYLIPNGARDIGTALAIVLRGLVANFAVVLAVVLMAAAFTILTNPNRSDLTCTDLLGLDLCKRITVHSFGITLVFALIGLAGLFAWAFCRSLRRPDRLVEFKSRLPVIAFFYLCLVAFFFFVELQAFVLEGMFVLAKQVKADGDPVAWLTGTVKALAVFAAPVAAAVTFFRQQLGDILKASSADATVSTKAIASASKVAFWVAGAALPLLVWVLYLYLSYWGIINDRFDETLTQKGVSDTVSVVSPGKDKGAVPIAEIDPGSSGGGTTGDNDLDLKKPPDCSAKPYVEQPDGAHTPAWLISGATRLSQGYFCPYLWWAFKPLYPTRWLFKEILARPMVLTYGGIGFFLLILVRFLRPNANSLHGLYRDRLSKAFLFDPGDRAKPADVARNQASIDQGRDFKQLDDMKVSQLSTRDAPYHLINAALNIQGSDYANRRGRNADFFVFSPRHLGSDATGYATTPAFEASAGDLNLATAMAISGAAASSNMGSSSIRPLRPTLALLNIRLGYWLKNPRYARQKRKVPWWSMGGRSSLFLWNEITGRLYENSNDVYLTDGGHIENLGVYELLKRRCKLIIVVDAEADFNLRCPSFITLQRYARIDFGIRIEMPWDAIRTTTCAWMGLHSKGKDDAEPSSGPHAAIGCIDYGEGRFGHILYLKASLTGDENDYIRDYARRFVIFPHETTGDQFFSEEQFEVYRALGFHIAHGVLSGRDAVCAPGSPCSFHSQDNEVVKTVRAALVPPAVANKAPTPE